MQDTIEGLQEIRELAAQFASERLRPHVERWDHERAMDESASAQLAELGFHGMLVPEAQGGLGFGTAAFVAVLEEIAWAEPAAAFALLCSASVAAALDSSRDASHNQWLGALAAGARSGATQLARDSALDAQHEGRDWVIDGRARWVLRGPGEQILLLAASVASERALFVVSAETEGLDSRDRETTIGLRCARLETVEARRVRLAESALALPAADIARIEMIEHLGTAAIALGIARAALEHARDYADIREQFGRKLRRFGGIQAKLADMDARVAATRALLGESAALPTPVSAARAKLFASETAMWTTTQAVQIFGGYGYMRDYPVEKLMRDAKTTEILTGANEVLRSLIAAGLYAD
jgi:alkylation response protein AidB-like acyl-CoA dehydrogenase